MEKLSEVQEEEKQSVLSSDKNENTQKSYQPWIFMVRHGERLDQRPDLKIKYPISFDPPLTPDGHIQAEITG